ncbi:MAG TPA: hypothetical protein VMX13_16880 [Sedimentisphaerales bacterium]|nr:hypothetical protein [Sedimentisphaerales bacterium]
MSETSTNHSPSTILSTLPKMLALAGGVLYAVGFYVVSLHMWGFALVMPPLLQTRYVPSGVWAVLPVMYPFLVIVWTAAITDWATQVSGDIAALARSKTLRYWLVGSAFIVSLLAGLPDNVIRLQLAMSKKPMLPGLATGGPNHV